MTTEAGEPDSLLAAATILGGLVLMFLVLCFACGGRPIWALGCVLLAVVVIHVGLGVSLYGETVRGALCGLVPDLTEPVMTARP